MTQRTPEELQSLIESLGPAETLLDLILNFPDHLWHNRPGVRLRGKWIQASNKQVAEFGETGKLREGTFVPAGPNVEAIELVYETLADIWKQNNELAARLASYIMRETDWRDMKVVCAAFMLVQKRAGEPVVDNTNGQREILFFDDDYREVGEAMIKFYQRQSNRMMSPKLIRRIGQVLALPGVAEINRKLGFGHPAKRKPFTGRYYKAVKDWLAFREANPSLLEGLKNAGFASTVKSLSRMTGFKPRTQRFFETLAWKQSQHRDGHRQIGLNGLKIGRLSFGGMTERQICETIVERGLGWKQVMGMLPKEIGLTPAIMVALLDRLSDKDLTILTPTLESLGLLEHSQIKERWTTALRHQEDQRSRNIARNLRNREDARAMEAAADAVVTKAVEEATAETDLHVMFLIDISASMEGAIRLSKEALSMIVQGFPKEKLHISVFNTVGQMLIPRHYSATGIKHLLSGVGTGGGTHYHMGLAAFQVNQVRIPKGAELLVIAVGDEAGEPGDEFARQARRYGYRISGIAHIVNVADGWNRGTTLRRASEVLHVPYTEVDVDQFRDVYQVQRTLKGLLEAQPWRKENGLVEKILRTELLTKPY